MPTWDFSFGLRVDLADRELVTLLAKVHAEAQLTAGMPLPPNTRKRLDALHIARAVRGTTGIEGSTVTEEEVSQILSLPAGAQVLTPGRAREEKEVRNAETVIRFAGEAAGAPITEELVRHIHTLVTEGIAYEHNDPGAYRSHQVHAGPYVPPGTNSEVRRLMTGFIKWMNSREVAAWDPAVQAIAAHFYLISIHPFGNGNGRTARALESMVLYRGGINVLGFYSLSNFYYQNRTEYMEMLDHVRFSSGGSLMPFILFALRGLYGELQAVTGEVIKAMRVVAFRDYARQRLLGEALPGRKVGMRLFTLLNFFLDDPGFRVTTAADLRGTELVREYVNLSGRTLQRDLALLLAMKLLTFGKSGFRPDIAAIDQFTALREASLSPSGPGAVDPASNRTQP